MSVSTVPILVLSGDKEQKELPCPVPSHSGNGMGFGLHNFAAGTPSSWVRHKGYRLFAGRWQLYCPLLLESLMHPKIFLGDRLSPLQKQLRPSKQTVRQEHS